jgi:DNA-binding transcriptional LysR family regulator
MSDAEPSWDLYETFLAVMRGGSLSAASRTLRVAQPTVRRRIEALEEALGAPLFVRAPNGLVPTDTAKATLGHAEAMSASAHALVRATSAPADAAEGTVRLSASEIVAVELLPRVLAPLRQRAPRLQLEISVSNQVVDLLRRDADVAVRMVAPTQASLVARKAAVLPVGLFAHPTYVKKHGLPRRLDELASRHVLIGADRGRGLLQALDAAGHALTRADFSWRSDNDLAQLAAVRAGLGIGVCQVPLGEATGLTRVLPSLAFPLEAWVVMHEDLRSVRRVRLVFDALVEGLGRLARRT